MAQRKWQHRLLKALRSGRVKAVWLGTPCSTFSRARRGPRNRPGPPPPLRSTALPWGLDDLAHAEQQVVDISNKLVRFTLTVIRTCIKLRIGVAVENPMSSILWQIPELQALLSQHGQNSVTDFCGWGERWRKSTRIFSWNLDLTECMRRCTGRSICSFSNKEHICLSGTDASGVWWTKRAEAYPLRWCSKLSQSIDKQCNRT